MVFNATFNNISVISWRGSKVDKNFKKKSYFVLDIFFLDKGFFPSFSEPGK